MGATIKLLKKLPIDVGQGELKHNTEAKIIALRHIPPAKRGARALDVGCRDGYYSEILKQRGYSVESVDIEPKYAYATVLDANGRLPWKNKAFDLVWCSEVIEHLESPEFSLSEFRRVLKPGGTLIITTPNSGCWFYLILALFGIPPKALQNAGHRHFFNINDIRRLFSNAILMGYFPYAVVKLTINHGLGLLTPAFVVIEKKP